MNLLDAVQSAFAQQGGLADALDSFQPRAGQTAMAVAVAETIAQRSVLVVEAGTGVGKTYAYLVPALLSGDRVLLSTATKTLQDQLYGRDLPRLVQALGLPVRTALLKGRSSYLCWHRLGQARQEHAAQAPGVAYALAKVERWAQQTRSGDLAELPGLDERSPVIPLVTSTRDNCLGSHCPRYRDCHVNLARREALAADVVVINHHLFFADLAVRESGMAELLPSVNTVIFDEAHQLNETGVQFLGRQLATSQVLDFCRDFLACGLQQARGLADWQQLTAEIERSARELRLCAGKAPSGGARLLWTQSAPERVNSDAWQAALSGLQRACEQARYALEQLDELGPDFMRLSERARALATTAAFFQSQPSDDAVRWAELSQHLRLVESPLDIAETVRDRLLAPREGESSTRSWIFTSATLGDDDQLSWFTEPCGLLDARVLKVESPFDYPAQAAIYVPRDLPKPADAQHPEAVADLVERLAAQLGGRTLVLTTSLRALRVIGERLPERLAPLGVQVLSQGQSAKRELLERLARGADPGEPGCVVVASASFWEGVDIPGEALQMVVIDKLPFPPPNDPLVQARSRRLEASGRNAFRDFHLPEAAVALKQGAGRLIRSEADRGLLVVCDTRLLSMSYGRRLLASLPPMRRVSGEDEAMDVLRSLR